ncbi:MAG TPA: polysaccharide biosynthesis/export family protein [Sphingopyxis sp.]|uniref:polysaccharide biosynthesis/export family protein n=1 Tax=Sphingopyxis sp. TaxID=1908224 RepID=UPI002BBD07FF|nr:polysaccharide biosynthesis/export family protein [Sphingopyxis sp.]HWW55881.1 polysaccharide biosynthesis/export family protein [Sphingopyxis sp.]
MTRVIFAAAVLAMTGGCAEKVLPLQSNQYIEVIGGTELPAPTQVAEGGYHIGAFDRLIVDVIGFEELNKREFQVDAAGNIALPIAGTVRAAGQTPEQVTGEIVAKMRAGHVRNPQVSVNLFQSTSQYVTVEGQVIEPGNYPVVGNMTLMRAVAAAKGAGEFAKLDDVVVFRTVGDKRMVALYNMAAIRRGYYPDPSVYAQDIVVVGDSPGRRMFSRIVQASALVTAPIIALVSSNAL